MVYAIAAFLIVAADQLLKIYIKLNVEKGELISLIPGLVDITYVENRGAAFGIFQNGRWSLIIVTVVFVVLIGIMLKKKMITHPAGIWILTGILAGAVGNLIDRIVYGYVIDMLSFSFFNFPVFNIADIFITCGGILLAVYVLFLYDRLEPKPEPTEKSALNEKEEE